MRAFLPGLFVLILLIACQPKKEDGLDQLRQGVTGKFDSIEGEFALAYLNLKDTSDYLLINEGERFHAASTMKVPVMIELFKQSAQGLYSINDSVLIKNEFKSIVDESLYSLDTADDSEKELYAILGEKRSIYDLNYDMIIWSSNLATNLLIEFADAKKVTQSMRDLGAADIEVLRGVEDIKAFEQGLSNSTTAKDLMVIFQAIASDNAGSPEDCAEMIKILKDQKFNEIIPALLPEDVEVAHKTGVITSLHHDAGIVYLPDGNAYVLVLLSKNLGDFDEGTNLMAEVSRMVYDYFTENK